MNAVLRRSGVLEARVPRELKQEEAACLRKRRARIDWGAVVFGLSFIVAYSLASLRECARRACVSVRIDEVGGL